jgi:uncharacterized repeat protein (TIGR02543 family)
MLQVTLTGGGTVQSSPAGISCTGSCSSSFAAGQTVTLTATAATGYVFGGWSGACAGSGLSCTVTMTAAQSVVAMFTSASSVCSTFYPSGFALVSGQGTYPIVTVGRLTKGVAFRDPVFGTCVVRATNHAVEPPSGFARNDYSRRQAFNADSSRFIVYAYDGYWHLYNAVTLAHVRVLPGLAGDAEPQWHPTDPNKLRYFPTNGAGGKLYELDIGSGQSVLLADFAAKVPAGTPTNFIWSKSEGSPSADHRYWCLMAEGADYITRRILVYDLQQQAFVGSTAAPEDPDHVSMSPSGQWCVASYGAPRGVVAYSRDFSVTKQIAGNGEHSDIALDAAGDDVYVSVDYQSNAGDVYMFNLRTNVRTVLFPNYVNGMATAMHFSGKAFNKRGWVLMSTYAENGSGTRQWLHRKVFAVQLSASPTILQLAHHHDVDAGYWTEPQATVNRDFTKVLFNSNWEVNSPQDVDAYLIELPTGAVQ